MNPILEFFYGEGDPVDGEFHCEGCAAVSTTAGFSEMLKTLRWVCPECNLKNIVEDFNV